MLATAGRNIVKTLAETFSYSVTYPPVANATCSSDQFWAVLAASRRRDAILVMADWMPGKCHTVTHLATEVAVREDPDADSAADISPADRKRLYQSLIHWHLPVLEDAGIITTYDNTPAEPKEVVRRSGIDPFVAAIERAPGADA